MTFSTSFKMETAHRFAKAAISNQPVGGQYQMTYADYVTYALQNITEVVRFAALQAKVRKLFDAGSDVTVANRDTSVIFRYTPARGKSQMAAWQDKPVSVIRVNKNQPGSEMAIKRSVVNKQTDAVKRIINLVLHKDFHIVRIMPASSRLF